MLGAVIPAIQETEIRKMIQGQLRQITGETPISKLTRAKRTGGVAQIVEHLLCKHETLSAHTHARMHATQQQQNYLHNTGRDCRLRKKFLASC
jgi:hypothetical protein